MRTRLLFVFTIALAAPGFTQVKKQFTVEDAGNCDEIVLALRSTSGQCFLKPSQQQDILNVFTNQSDQTFTQHFKRETKGRTCFVLLNLKDQHHDGMGQSISSRFFGGSEEPNAHKIWKMYLTEDKPYSLDLSYGIGRAHVDLSGLAIRKLKINTGSADVNIGYFSELENQMEMDTFFVKADLGTVNVRNMSLSRTHNVIAEVGFGNMTLDFTDAPKVSNKIKGSVGAGSLTILLPAKTTPFLIKIKESWLCTVELPDNLKKLSETTYTSSTWTKDAKNTLVFDLDVSMGKIVFVSSEN